MILGVYFALSGDAAYARALAQGEALTIADALRLAHAI